MPKVLTVHNLEDRIVTLASRITKEKVGLAIEEVDMGAFTPAHGMEVVVMDKKNIIAIKKGIMEVTIVVE